MGPLHGIDQPLPPCRTSLDWRVNHLSITASNSFISAADVTWLFVNYNAACSSPFDRTTYSVEPFQKHTTPKQADPETARC